MKYYFAAVLTVIAACQCYSVYEAATGKDAERAFEVVNNVLELRGIGTGGPIALSRGGK